MGREAGREKEGKEMKWRRWGGEDWKRGGIEGEVIVKRGKGRGKVKEIMTLKRWN